MHRPSEKKNYFRGREFFISALIFCLGAFGFPEARASDSSLEYKVKAAFLLNFAKFVEWPPQSFSDGASPIVIGILGDNPFGNSLENTVRGQELNGREFVIKPSRNFEDLKNCHLLFISGSESAAAPEILKRLEQTSVLTISDMENFLENGGIIRFVKKENKVRFQINEAAVKAANLKVSSKLLSLAVRP